jgi:hypothetical protein
MTSSLNASLAGCREEQARAKGQFEAELQRAGEEAARERESWARERKALDERSRLALAEADARTQALLTNKEQQCIRVEAELRDRV